MTLEYPRFPPGAARCGALQQPLQGLRFGIALGAGVTALPGGHQDAWWMVDAWWMDDMDYPLAIYPLVNIQKAMENHLFNG